MIRANGLRKNYGDLEALRGVSFAVEGGEIIGLLGPNGAGKTTLMQILTGFIQPTAGQALVGGIDVLAQPGKVQEMIGYLPENAPLYPELTVQSYLKMIADLRRLPVNKQPALIAEAVDAVGLRDRLVRPIGTLSKGYRQRVGLAQAILHQPQLLILDEPTNGLDPTQIVEVRKLIRTLAQKSTVLLSTHILSEVEATCDRAIIIMRGEVKSDARLSALAATADAVVTLTGCPGGEAQTVLEGVGGVQRVAIVSEGAGRVQLRVHGSTNQDLCPAIYSLAREHDWVLSELRKDVKTLEAVFGEIAARDGGVQ